MNFFKNISAIFHPLLAPLYFFIVMFFTLGMFSFQLKNIFFLFLFILFSLVILPAFVIRFCKKFSIIKEIDLPSKKDGAIILGILLVFYLFNLRMWYLKDPDIIYLYVFGLFAMNAALLLIFNFFYPLNWHTTVWGSLFGFYLVMIKAGANFSFPILALIILISGLVAVSRIKIAQTKQLPLYWGAGLGFVAAYLLGITLLVY
jgi:hypothetical protein